MNFPSYQANGVLAPIEIANPEAYRQSLIESYSVDGTSYAVPTSFSNVVLYYNADLFDAAGIDYPTNDWTWEDEKEAAEKQRLAAEAAERERIAREAADKALAEKASADKALADKASAEKALADKALADKAVAEKAAKERAEKALHTLEIYRRRPLIVGATPAVDDTQHLFFMRRQQIHNFHIVFRQPYRLEHPLVLGLPRGGAPAAPGAALLSLLSLTVLVPWDHPASAADPGPAGTSLTLVPSSGGSVASAAAV